jgi:GAF domain-containing protein
MSNPVTTMETQRLEELARYEILDTPPEGTFNRITALAAKIFNVPIAIVSLVDTDRIWFMSHYGLDINQIGRDPGLCSSAIMSDDIYLVEDARKDPRALANPLVAGTFGLQFYAAAPLKTKAGFNIGTFCIMDKKKRYINTEQQQILADMAKIVMENIELRLQARLAVRDLKKQP